MKLHNRYIFVGALTLVVLAGVVGAVVYSLRDPAEFTYKGKPLSEYLISMVPGHGNYDTDFQEAKAALIEAGTNAMPVLFRMLRAHDSALRLKLDTVGRKLGLIRKPFTPASLKNQAAAAAFVILGSSAKDCAPELVKIFHENISQDSQLSALGALSRIGPLAVQATASLIPGLTNTNHYVRAQVVQTLGYIWATPKLAVPELVKCLNDPYARVRLDAAHVLGGYRARAEAAVPALIAALKDTDSRVRLEVRLAIWKINPDTYHQLAGEGRVPESADSDPTQ